MTAVIFIGGPLHGKQDDLVVQQAYHTLVLEPIKATDPLPPEPGVGNLREHVYLAYRFYEGPWLYLHQSLKLVPLD
jgi:hypothetical protein